MRTIYLKSIPTNSFSQIYYYKIVEIDKTTTMTMTVLKDSIDIDKDEEFFDQVSFIKNKQCEGNSVEITNDEFNEIYNRTLSKINNVFIA
ncbi:hypothetical protein [Seonamhaeicola sp.]|uniref:hypothetical protein n=1 Tax=Seonamhaeicola sp. TaxID=1912245 RepID=UPI00356435FB